MTAQPLLGKEVAAILGLFPPFVSSRPKRATEHGQGHMLNNAVLKRVQQDHSLEEGYWPDLDTSEPG